MAVNILGSGVLPVVGLRELQEITSLDYTFSTGLSEVLNVVTTNNSEIDHDLLSNFLANEHIDWTNSTNNLTTSGSISGDSVTLGTGASVDTIETTITDDDIHIASSGAIVDYVNSNVTTYGKAMIPDSVYISGSTTETDIIVDNTITDTIYDNQDTYKFEVVGELIAVAAGTAIFKVYKGTTEIASYTAPSLTNNSEYFTITCWIGTNDGIRTFAVWKFEVSLSSVDIVYERETSLIDHGSDAGLKMTATLDSADVDLELDILYATLNKTEV